LHSATYRVRVACPRVPGEAELRVQVQEPGRLRVPGRAVLGLVPVMALAQERGLRVAVQAPVMALAQERGLRVVVRVPEARQVEDSAKVSHPVQAPGSC
jgi:hypothetical protein